jgi:DnaJ-class molecular chaperone
MKKKYLYHKCEFLTDGGSCIICGQTVVDFLDKTIMCHKCHGFGILIVNDGHGSSRICYDCNGSGYKKIKKIV